METLSDDLISMILVRVPVKSLLRCQFVSKTWSSKINNPTFVKSQLRHAITNLADQTLIINRSHCYQNGKQVLRLHVDSRQTEDDLKYPFPRSELRFSYVSNICIVGSANGIVCVAVDFGCTIVWSDFGVETMIYLWNPAIGQSKLVPSDVQTYGEGSWKLGFGYDEIDQDYKVLRVVTSSAWRVRSSFSAEVYSDNGNVWRKVPDPMDIPRQDHFDVCVKGFLCGIGSDGMVAFDLNKEVMNCDIELPLIFDDEDDARIIEFNNSVAIIILRNDRDWSKSWWTMDEMINIWTLDDDACLGGGGVEASWTPMFNIDIVTRKDIKIRAKIILCYFSNGKLLLLTISDRYMWISFDPEKKEAEIFPFEVDMTYLYTRDVYKYIESLVSLDGFEDVKW